MAMLEHFYYGPLVHHGSIKGNARVLAKSAGIQDEQISAALKAGHPAPLADAPQAAWGILRGARGGPYWLPRARQGAAGEVMVHFIQLPPDFVRALLGQLRHLLPLLRQTIPVFDKLGDPLPLIPLEDPQPMSTSQQAEYLMDLMNFTGNKTRTIEPLLAAILQGLPLVIQHAPPDLETRTAFLQGLLTLLPSSTRFGVSFATNAGADGALAAQVYFMDSAAPDGALVYDWATQQNSGAEPKDEYSRFILAQLRLDAEVAVRQIEELTPVAGWRFKAGETLTEALAYASYRSRLDKALLSNLPVNVEEVAKVLSEDPTLEDSLKARYVDHVMRFSVALGDMSYADAAAVVLPQYPDLAESARQQMREAALQGKGGLIFSTLQRWMQNPLSPQGPEWVSLLHESAVAHLNELVREEDLEGMIELLDDLLTLDISLGVERILPSIFERVVPFMAQDDRLGLRLLDLAVLYADDAAFQRLLSVPAFAGYLPRSIKRALELMGRHRDPMPGILLEAAASVGERARGVALLRFAQLAHVTHSSGMIDTPVLAELVKASTAPESRAYQGLLVTLARTMMDEGFEQLVPPGPRHVLQILLACERYDLLARGMVEQSRTLYGGDRQHEYIEMVQQLFAETPLKPPQYVRALEMTAKLGIGETPLLMAGIGAVQGSDGADELLKVAQNSVRLLETNRRLLQALHPGAVLAVLRYFVQRGDLPAVQRSARLVPALAVARDERSSLETINEAYRVLGGDERYRADGFEVLREFVRGAQPSAVQRVVRYFGRNLGKEAERRLEMSAITNLLTSQSDFITYAGAVNVTAELLQELIETYAAGSTPPSLADLSAVLKNINYSLDHIGRGQFAQHLKQMAQAIVLLGEQNLHATGTRSLRINEAMLEGKENPRCALDVLRIISGYLTKGRALRTVIPPSRSTPFRNNRPEELLGHTGIAQEVLQGLVLAFPPEQPPKWNVTELRDEVESIVRVLPPTEASIALKRIAVDYQRIADMVVMIVRDGDPSVIDENSKLGKRMDSQNVQPRSTLEMMRFIYSYFLD